MQYSPTDGHLGGPHRLATALNIGVQISVQVLALGPFGFRHKSGIAELDTVIWKT